MAQLLLLSSVAFGSDKPASCELASKNIVSRSSSGFAQVSHLGDIEITCRVPARLFPTKPGEGQNGLRAVTTAYEISPNRSKKSVPSEVRESGGGFGPDPEGEWVDFYVHIPLKSAERDSEVRRYLAKLENSMAPEQITEEAHQRALERTRELVYQHRVGHFQVECRVFDGNRVMGVGIVEFEVHSRAVSPTSGSLPLLRFRSIHGNHFEDKERKQRLHQLRIRWETTSQSPAIANGSCRMHGGASTGPRTAEGLARSRRARWKHGLYSAEALAEQKRVRGLLS